MVPDLVLRWAVYAAMAVALFGAGFLKGCDHGSEKFNVLAGTLKQEEARVIRETEIIVREVIVEKQAQVEFFGGWTHEVKLEMAAAPVMPAVCNVATGLLNDGISAANCAGRVHEPGCAAYLSAGADGHTQRTQGLDGNEPSGDRPDPD